MLVRHVSRLNDRYYELLRVADLDGMLELYEPSAMVQLATGARLEGRQQIRIHFERLLALRGDRVETHLSCVELGDLALIHSRWTLDGVDASGAHATLGGYSSKVARRTDGAWRYLIDVPIADVL